MLDRFNHIPLLKNATRCDAINAGFSKAEKFIVTTNDARYLLKTYEPADSASITNTYNALKQMEVLGVRASRAIEIGTTPSTGQPYFLQTYLEGDDAAETLPGLPNHQQHAIGVEAGRELKKIHQHRAPDDYPGWSTVKTQKHQRYLAAYKQSGIKFSQDTVVNDFIQARLHLMDGQPNAFQHDDYHPANLIIKDQKFEGVIDFDRHDWGDPVHDLLKIPLFTVETSVPFSIGQIMGYTDQTPGPAFWGRYALYTAMALFSSVVWVQQAAPDRTAEMMRRIQRVLEDHKNFERVEPVWFS